MATKKTATKAPAKQTQIEDDARDASLRVSKRMRDSLKATAAVMGRPLYDVTNEAINSYLSSIKLGDPLQAIRRTAPRGRK
jgi:hypothetical protein